MSEPVVPSAESAPAPLIRIPLVEMEGEKRVWTLEIHPAHLALFPPGEQQPFIFLRTDTGARFILVPWGQTLVFKLAKQHLFRPGPGPYRQLKEWVGPPGYEQLKFELRRRSGWTLAMGIIFVFLALPATGNPTADIPNRPLSPFLLILGLLPLAMWAIARFRPHAVFFLVDAAWFTALGASLVLRIWHGESLWWLVVVALNSLMVLGAWTLYQKYSQTKPPTNR
ncbi:MAG: hypothetical protein H7X97_12695 [Opitutaceae bacterium]|nr:hypothetical protein [Verrucomicrobiales bacterium]